jgi:hypothetical protein
MATHAHYMSELNSIFQYKWIIYDSYTAMNFMGLEYKIKSNKMSNNVCILYTGIPIIKNLTETVNISKAIFDCKDNFAKNITFKALQGII